MSRPPGVVRGELGHCNFHFWYYNLRRLPIAALKSELGQLRENIVIPAWHAQSLAQWQHNLLLLRSIHRVSLVGTGVLRELLPTIR